MIEEQIIRLERWQCPRCQTIYPTALEAVACLQRAQLPVPFEVGEIITLPPIYGWFDGDKNWIAPGRGKFHATETLEFYWVITAIDERPADNWKNPCPEEHHIPRYHLATRAIFLRDGVSPLSGWNCPATHCPMRKVESPPPEVVESSRDLIGQKYPWLL